MNPSSKPFMSPSRSQTQPGTNLPSWLNDSTTPDPHTALAIFDQHRGHNRASGHKQPTVVDYPTPRQNSTPNLMHQGSHAHTNKQKPHAQLPSQGGGLSPDVAALLQELTRNRAPREGHTYGDVLIEGEATVVQGNFYDDPNVVMAKHKYAGVVRIAPGGKSNLFRGDQPMALAKLILKNP